MNNIIKILGLCIALCALPSAVMAGNNPSLVPSVPTISAMKALAAASAQYPNLIVTDYGNGVGGGGYFVWSPSSTASTDSCTIFAATGVGTGRWMRSGYTNITPEMCGAFRNGTANSTAGTDDALAVNTAFSVATAKKIPLLLGPGTYLMKSSFNTSAISAAVSTSNGGCQVTGTGSVSTYLQYVGATNNAANSVAWDGVGFARCTFTGFAVISGTPSGNNSAEAVLHLGAVNSGGFIFSGSTVFNDIQFNQNQGTYVALDEGAEQLHFQDCIFFQLNSSGEGPLAFRAQGSSVIMTSANTTINTPVASMTDVLVDGTRGVINTASPYAIRFLYNAAGAAGSMQFNAQFFQTATASGTPFYMISDNTAGAVAGTKLAGITAIGTILEANTVNTDLRVADVETSTIDAINIQGETNAASVTSNPFRFTNAPTRSHVDWNPAAGGTWTGSFIADTNGKNATGLSVTSNVVNAKLISDGSAQGSSTTVGTDTTLTH